MTSGRRSWPTCPPAGAGSAPKSWPWLVKAARSAFPNPPKPSLPFEMNGPNRLAQGTPIGVERVEILDGGDGRQRLGAGVGPGHRVAGLSRADPVGGPRR